MKAYYEDEFVTLYHARCRMTRHPLVSVDGIGEARWSVCGCGWVSAVVADRRSAVQAHEEHEREKR